MIGDECRAASGCSCVERQREEVADKLLGAGGDSINWCIVEQIRLM